MGLFGKSFAQKVDEAVAAVKAKVPEVKNRRAVLDGKVATLEGEAPDLNVKSRVVNEFNVLVNTENTINKIKLAEPPAPAAAPPAAPPAESEQVHVVVAGDTLSALALKYYGKAGMYMKIFEANRDILANPDLIRVGQKLRIPK